MSHFKLAVYQAVPPSGDLEAGLKTIDRALSEAVENRVDILTMPELSLPSYVAATRGLPTGFHEAMVELSKIVARHRVALVIGLPEFAGEATYNAAFAFGPDGRELARYRKIQLYGDLERGAFQPGNAYVTFDYRNRKFGLLVCYDVEFPEHVRALARIGCDAILVPTANMTPFTFVGSRIVPARAIESGVSIAYANYCGREAHLTFTEQSAIATPDNRLVLIEQGEGLIAIEIPGDGCPPDIPLQTQLTDYRPVGNDEQ